MCFALAAACDVLVLPTSTAKRYHCGVCGVLCFLSAVLCDVHLNLAVCAHHAAQPHPESQVRRTQSMGRPALTHKHLLTTTLCPVRVHW